MMNTLVYSFVKNLIICLCLLSLLFSSCKKVDEHIQFIDSQPAFAMSTVFGAINVPSLQIFNWRYPKVLISGDTATFVGRFFIDQPGLELKVGNVPAKLVTKLHTPAGSGKGDQPLDVIRFVVTKEMGLGPNIPVQLTANHVTIAGPFIEIRAFAGEKGETDPSFWVDKIITWLPADADEYRKKGLAFVNASCIDGAGHVYFTNSRGVFVIRDQQVRPLLKTGDQFNEKGTAYTLSVIQGSAISFDGQTLYFSAAVTENNTDGNGYYIFRLCRLDMTSGEVTTLNRTLVKKGTGSKNENPAPYEGNSDKVKLVASNLKTDINGNLYFVNCFSPESPGKNNDNWYTNTSGIGSGMTDNSPECLSNICQISPSGKLSSLFFQQPFSGSPKYNPPGYKTDWSADYLISLDGNTAAISTDFSNYVTVGLTFFDLNENLPISTLTNNQEFKFTSYETVTALKWPYSDLGSSFAFDETYTRLMTGILPNGNLINVQGASIASFNWRNLTTYCYAGTEVSLGGVMPPDQKEIVGKAKNVVFGGIVFTGIDRNGSLYYFKNGGLYSSDYTKGVTFYKLYAKK